MIRICDICFGLDQCETVYINGTRTAMCERCYEDYKKENKIGVHR